MLLSSLPIIPPRLSLCQHCNPSLLSHFLISNRIIEDNHCFHERNAAKFFSIISIIAIFFFLKQQSFKNETLSGYLFIPQCLSLKMERRLPNRIKKKLNEEIELEWMCRRGNRYWFTVFHFLNGNLSYMCVENVSIFRSDSFNNSHEREKRIYDAFLFLVNPSPSL